MKLKGYTISVVKFMDHFKNKTWLLFKCLGKKKLCSDEFQTTPYHPHYLNHCIIIRTVACG